MKQRHLALIAHCGLLAAPVCLQAADATPPATETKPPLLKQNATATDKSDHNHRC